MTKRLVLILFIITSVFYLTSCDENSLDPVLNGNIELSSNPTGAQVWVDGVNTDEVTPMILSDEVGKTIQITLKKENYVDVVFSATFTEEDQTITKTLDLSEFTLESQPSGAEVFFGGTKVGETPYMVPADQQNPMYTLLMPGYRDTVVSVSESMTVVLTSAIVQFGSEENPILIEANEFSADKPFSKQTNLHGTMYVGDGIDLSVGKNEIINDKYNLDLFYSIGWGDVLVDGRTGYSDDTQTRMTYVKRTDFVNVNNGEGADVFDANNAGSVGETWNRRSIIQTTTYYIAYDSDGHYSKFKILEKGGSGASAYIKVMWLYNTNPGDTAFPIIE